MSFLSNAKGHFCTITRHKLLVMHECFQVGLYKQGLLHDLSKYTLTEFIPGIKYYQGTRSPNAAEREDIGYSTAWLHHKGRNKHHLEYWTDITDDSSKGLMGVEMPPRYVIEMFLDRIAASKVYAGSNYTDRTALEYYQNKNEYAYIHPRTRKQLEKLLHMLAEDGEAKTFAYIKKKIVPKLKSR